MSKEPDKTSIKNIHAFYADIISVIQEQLLFLVDHDPLTTLYNRTYLAKLFNDASDIDNGIDYIETYSIAILIDVNHFKEINNQYGHAAGDKVLIRLAEWLKNACRKTDYVFRIGGDEFLIILTNLDVEDVSRLEIEMTKKLESFLEKTTLDFSFSFSIVSGKSTEIEQLVLNVDNKMYQIKQMNIKEKINS